ncbi:uncharacterized protein LOC120178714 [Hibiscus syriacus]|uniref:uncharacterized protein LOC120178714 n=1 Tax=Hibiscus syriacus TaxID=106335 RepID=UPI0019204393|nr:uncharacterized protein LOC120178714 [Hibiscus syriacus]
MEALWSLEEKWKLTTQEDVIVVVCAASAIVGLCAAAVLKKKARKKPVEDGDAVSERSTNAKWLGGEEVAVAGIGRVRRRCGVDEPELRVASVATIDTHGGKCELPRFSELFLYDERGQLLDDSIERSSNQGDYHQGKSSAVVRTTLRDL